MLERPADNFVHCIVTPNVFAKDNQFAVLVEERGCVKAASPSEDSLTCMKFFGKRAENFRIYGEV